ncbi:uncharacterized protein CMU_005850 [Cryptosporidium muris RN66]|uniref:t-SNARE coiled-coil homology domain-containing protein n=1 Tax=Cryptosporidium muris (strain RN66) TaxID=441375 RepID=B6AHG7_CRYMR|nr:uncharacterized protein CMU_005850 [Cryptosporidium muris RN66]EEA07662.1 hypothetical protein, conserved [Cryptosporidium muris RN66]|eukprot:XP_002142011.1 hypothetical protein [Cryptosporidium muris RN66]
MSGKEYYKNLFNNNKNDISNSLSEEIDHKYDDEDNLDTDWTNSNNNGVNPNYPDVHTSSLNILESTVSQLKNIGYGIQSEVRLHLDMLGDMNNSMGSTGRRIKITQRVLNRLTEMASTTTLCLIAMVLFILLILQWVILF